MRQNWKFNINLAIPCNSYILIVVRNQIFRYLVFFVSQVW